MSKLDDQRLLNQFNRMNDLREKVTKAAEALRDAKMELAAYKKLLNTELEDQWNEHIRKILNGKIDV